jgi:hypothetical protein
MREHDDLQLSCGHALIIQISFARFVPTKVGYSRTDHLIGHPCRNCFQFLSVELGRAVIVKKRNATGKLTKLYMIRALQISYCPIYAVTSLPKDSFLRNPSKNIPVVRSFRCVGSMVVTIQFQDELNLEKDFD